ncbi:methionine synthase [Cellulomonas sp. KRMCY2]|uniref:methionine synthase n=1 Tax=Cellulomonas sp. KRMCY2 TaxID=1304865 RepID=UPI00045EA3E5|nr:methionine synthase [Cellulomonas sp. KRMCY2]
MLDDPTTTRSARDTRLGGTGPSGSAQVAGLAGHTLGQDEVTIVSTTQDITDRARERILVLDGAWGTMFQRAELREDDFRFDGADPERSYRGNFDLLQLTRPDLVAHIHEQYFAAGADIASTNTFNANAISQADYGTERLVAAMNESAARIARTVADEAEARDGRPRWVAGAVGPTNRTASLSPDVERPGFRNITFDQLAEAYTEQIVSLISGGADLLLVETVFDTLNAKAALFACEEAFAATGRRLPIMLSGTITDQSGRTLSGQTPEAFAISTEHADLLSVGLNCALGPELLRPHLRELAESTTALISTHPNAGLPNAFGGYDETPEQMAAVLGDFARQGLLNIVGGCCGTSPAHIRAIAEAVAGIPPRTPGAPSPYLRLSGLEPFVVTPETNFVNVGERTNVTGSPRFAAAVRAGDDAAAVAIAEQQVVGGAQIVDVNVDEGMLDGPETMSRFLNLLAVEPEIARVPVMIDSSDWNVIEAGLKRVQGKAVVNSISLKDGEAAFLQRARRVHRYGAAVVVMAFDEDGQADTLERRKEVCGRAYRLLTEDAGYAPHDIIFDPNVLTVATGMSEHDRYALDFIEAVRWIKANLPGALTSGGISNVSFSFRGNNHVREAMHAVFLSHAIAAGLDMGIVNAGMLTVDTDLDPELRAAVEDVILARRPDATERLIALAESYKGVTKDAVAEQAWRSLPVGERLSHALVHGLVEHVVADAEESYLELGSPLAVIEGPLMSGMDIVGDLFGAGKMFLPQVVKSARVMKTAVGHLTPYLEAEKAEREAAGEIGRRGKGTIVMATVKGDVHDIGKNIVGVVLACNGYVVHDLGVMVPAERILAAAAELDADIIGVSGLITPSLHEMVSLAAEMSRRGLTTPLMVGGATTSKAHTAVKIDPAYAHTVVHSVDASRAVGVVADLLARPEELAARITAEYDEVRARHRDKDHALVPLELARKRATRLPAPTPPAPRNPGRRVVEPSVADLVELIDWTPFFSAWELRGTFPKILDDPRQGEHARSVYDDARALLDRVVAEGLLTARGVVGIWPARRVGDDVELYADHLPPAGTPGEPLAVLHTLRQQRERDGDYTALADYVGLAGDHVGAFAVAIHGAQEIATVAEAAVDDYTAIMIKAVADRLAEAFAEWLHREVRVDLWGYAPDEALENTDLIKERYAGIRPAPGYPAQPDHTEKTTLWSLLEPDEIGIELTESFAMTPTSAVSGLFLAHPDARYFAVGKIGRDQVVDYAERKGWTLVEAEHWLAPALGYDPDQGA